MSKKNGTIYLQQSQVGEGIVTRSGGLVVQLVDLDVESCVFYAQIRVELELDERAILERDGYGR